MKIYTVLEFLDYYCAEIVAVFAHEKDAKDYIEKHFWKDEDGDRGIWYEEHEVM